MSGGELRVLTMVAGLIDEVPVDVVAHLTNPGPVVAWPALSDQAALSRVMARLIT